MSKEQFFIPFRRAWYKAMKPQTIQGGFRQCGVWPLDEDKIDSKWFQAKIALGKGFNMVVGYTSCSPSKPSWLVCQVNKIFHCCVSGYAGEATGTSVRELEKRAVQALQDDASATSVTGGETTEQPDTQSTEG